MIYEIDQYYYVRALQLEDADGPYPLWFQDQDVCKYNRHGKFPKSRAYFHDYIASLNNEQNVVWAICHKNDGHIGNIALENIGAINRSAEFAIIMGDRRHWGKGIARQAGRVLVKHGFRKLNLHRISCGTAEDNISMKNLALSLGMKQEGVRREALFLDGRWVNVVEFGMLRSDFAEESVRWS